MSKLVIYIVRGLIRKKASSSTLFILSFYSCFLVCLIEPLYPSIHLIYSSPRMNKCIIHKYMYKYTLLLACLVNKCVASYYLLHLLIVNLNPNNALLMVLLHPLQHFKLQPQLNTVEFHFIIFHTVGWFHRTGEQSSVRSVRGLFTIKGYTTFPVHSSKLNSSVVETSLESQI
jgi:hypothetical protein